MKTKRIYGSVTSEGKIDVSKKYYLNQVVIFSNKVRNEIENKLKEILGKDAEIVKRDINSEIHQIYQRK